MYRITVIILYLLFTISSSWAQRPLYSYFRNLKVEDGLPQSFVSGLQQDKEGFLWVGTRDGLARYDGRNFVVFRHQDKDSFSISSNVIVGLYKDPSGLLWVQYPFFQADCFDPLAQKIIRNPETATLKKLLLEFKTERFIKDHAGNYWIINNWDGLIRYETATGKITRYRDLRSGRLYNVTESQPGEICLYGDKGLEFITREGSQFVPMGEQNRPFSGNEFDYKISVMQGGGLVLADKGRIILFDRFKKSFFPLEIPGQKNIIRHLVTGADGLLYIESGGQVYRMEKDRHFNLLWKYDGHDQSENYAISLLVDRSGVLWFGSNANGIYKIDLQSLPFTSAAYDRNFITDILSVETKAASGLSEKTKAAKWSYNLRYCRGPGNTIWISQDDYRDNDAAGVVYELNNNTLSTLKFPAGNHLPLRGLSFSPAGILHAVDIAGNIWSWKNRHQLPVYTPSQLSLPATSIVVDMEADDSEYWISTNKNGLYQVRNNSLVRNYTAEDTSLGWPTNYLTDLCRDPADNKVLWIGTLGYGLIRLNKESGSFRVFTTEDGLPNNTIYGIVPDKNHVLWISTNQGICRFEKEGKRVQQFDVKDGLPGNEFNRFHHFRTADGRISFGGIEGYTIFDPAKFSRDTFNTPVAITKLLINNTPAEYTGQKGSLSAPLGGLTELELPYNKNFLQFEFAGMQFNKPSKIMYRYKLEGYDHDWISANGHNVAVYTRLPSGHYHLLLNATNTSGKWSTEIKKISIRIHPPFWASWWAYTIYGIMVLLAVRVYWNYRNRQLRLRHAVELEQNKARQIEEVEKMKERFFSNITHELRTPLTLILTPLEQLKKSNHPSYADRRMVDSAYRNAEQLLRLINQLLDISKLESGQMKLFPTIGEAGGFTLQCVDQFRLAAAAKKIDLQVNNEITGVYLFDKDKWEKILFNLLSNALKFTREGGKVLVSLSTWNGVDSGETFMQLSVEDNGIGIEEKDIPRLFDRFYMSDGAAARNHHGTGIGLALVKELVQFMKGTITVSSQPGAGSTFRVKVPVVKADDQLFQPDRQLKNRIIEDKTAGNLGTVPDTRKPVVVVAEDNEELLLFLKGNLSKNWQVLATGNGIHAWEMIQEELPDLIISDVMMPGIDGYELCRKAKTDARSGHIGFILLSARAAHESRLSGLLEGADAYLSKPFHLDELEQQMHNLLYLQDRLRKHLQEELLPKTPLRVLPQVSDSFLKELYNQLDLLIDDPGLSVEKLAQSVAMSQRTLNRKLKAVLNITPVEFIRQYRLQKASVLLSSGQSVSDIAYTVGFETASYFSQCFKEYFGKTPTEYITQKTA